MTSRWEKFKSREPDGYYSFVWWETIIWFLLPAMALVSFILALFISYWLIVLAIIFWVVDIYWSRRELKGREKYFDKNG